MTSASCLPKHHRPKTRGYKPGRFSFNVKGGRCEACSGHGQKLVEMHFLPDVWITCDVCKGLRFNKETLQVKYKEKPLLMCLIWTWAKRSNFSRTFRASTASSPRCTMWGWITSNWGKVPPPFPAGEAQRVKLAKELSRVANRRYRVYSR
jgi:excinuclease ABC subunit A